MRVVGLLDFASVMLMHPLLLAVLALMAAVLFGVGRSMGLPLLFWHELPSHRFLAGLATTLLAGHVVFVSYLLDGDARFPGRAGLVIFFFIGGVLWLLVVAAAAILRSGRYQRADDSGGHTRMSPEPGVAPAMQTTASGSARDLQAVQLPVGMFLAGVACAAIMISALLVGGFALARPAWAARFIQQLASCRSVSDPLLHLLAAGGFGLFALCFVVLRKIATPAIGLAVLLALVVSVEGAVDFWMCNTGVGLLFLLALLGLAGVRRYKIRVPAFSDRYPAPTAYPPVAARAQSLLPGLHLPARYTNETRHPLIVVCASGGGLRAAAWTAAVLGRLDEIAGVRPAIRLITGASGGMVGAAAWVAWLKGRGGDPTRAAPAGGWPSLLETVAMDSLTPLARRLVFRDLPWGFLPINNPHDRGRAMEDAWVSGMRASELKIDLGLCFADLRAAEGEGELPSLVYTPMMIEDGRRLIISNRDLAAVSENDVCWLASPDNPHPHSGPVSRSSYHVADLVPDRWADLPLSTAARLSASFPYISPAALLPTTPRRRVVDAGYFDNYGLDLMSNWLREGLTQGKGWLDRISGILLVQIRDSVSQLSVSPDDVDLPQVAPDARGFAAAVARGFEGLTTPPSGLLASREAVSLFRSDAQVETLCRLYASASGDPDFLATTIFEFHGEASLSWYLTRQETTSLRELAAAPAIDAKLAAIERWLATVRPPPV